MSAVKILGSGRVGTALAQKLVQSGHLVVDDVSDAQVVVNATPGEGSLERLAAMRESLRGKVLLDVSNGGSGAASLQAALPGTSVVKSLNTMAYMVMVEPGLVSTPPKAFLSGDDANAKALVSDLLYDMGWNRAWIEDLGGIDSARAVEGIALLIPHLARTRGFVPFALTVADR